MSNTVKDSTIYVVSKIDSRRYCKTNGQFTRHLRKHNLSYQQYYETYITCVEEKCPYCNESRTFYQKDHSYAVTCGSPICIGKEISVTKQNWTNEQKFADSLNKRAALADKSKEFYIDRKRKTEETSLARYGTSYPTQSSEFKDKSRKTKLERYGNEYYAGWEKSAEINRNKSVEEQNNINNKRRETNKKLYGVEYNFLKPEAISKSRKSNALGKEYILPSGRIAGVRGYENIVLDRLFEQGYTESDLLFHDKTSAYKLPVFEYINFNMHTSKYYPDIYIRSENRIIEVKSRWWWDGNGQEKYKGRLINNQRKAAAVLERGYIYEVWLLKSNKDCEIIKYV